MVINYNSVLKKVNLHCIIGLMVVYVNIPIAYSQFNIEWKTNQSSKYMN
jgi:hypothetical protein